MKKLAHYTVSQVRVAATCPRIHYFDAEQTRRQGLPKPAITRIWKSGGGGTTAGGARFHRVVERFNREAGSADAVLEALASRSGPTGIEMALMRYVNHHCIDLEALAVRPVPERQAFILALQTYIRELADIAHASLSGGSDAQTLRTQLFGDQRRRVDVTFHVADGEQVHVTGAVDYVFYDARTQSHRIVDYKLTPAHEPNGDLFQVCSYALMHHHQHATTPDIAVFYLHPRRQVFEKRWSDLTRERHKIYELIASMVGWQDYDERHKSGLLPPGNPAYCGGCKWSAQCTARLGPKSEGAFDRRWRALGSGGEERVPAVVKHEPPRVVDEDDEPEADEERAPDLPVSPEEEPTGLVLGKTSTGKLVTLDPAVLRTHVAVVGAAGSGKTWMAKVIAEEAIRARIPVLAVDPQGDLVQFLTARPEAQVEAPHRRAREEFLRVVEPRIFTPGTSHGVRLSLDPIRVPGPGDLDHIQSRDRREEEERTMLEQVAGNLVGLAKAGGEVESQRAFVYRILVAISKARGGGATTLRDIVDVLHEPEAAGIDEPDRIVKKAERERLARKLNALVEGPSSALFTGGVRLDLGALLTPGTAGRVPLNVVYLNALADDDQKHFFLASLATEIYRWMVTSLDASSGPPNLLFYLDEARDFIPAGTSKPPAKQPLIRLFTQGRKYGVACLFCTQSPRSVDYNVFGNASTKIIGRLEAAQDVERVAQWFTTTGPVPEWVAGRKGAEPGSFVGRWPGGEAFDGVPLRSRPLFTAHEGAWSADRVEREVDAAGLRPR